MYFNTMTNLPTDHNIPGCYSHQPQGPPPETVDRVVCFMSLCAFSWG